MALDINAARARATKVAKSFSPQQMLILGGLGIVTVMGMVALVRWVSQPTYSALLAGANPAETAKVTEALDGAGLPYKLSGNGSGVMVAQADLARARLAMTAAGISATGQAAGYELLDGEGLTTSDFKQQVNYKRALEGELANTLLAMDGVDSARVTLSLPEKAVFKDDQDAPRASVLVGANGALDGTGVRAIMQTVAAAVPGLTTDNVTVTDTTGRILSLAGMSAEDDPMQLAHKYEAATTAQAQSMLDAIFGPGKAVVRVNAALELNEQSSKEIVYDTTNTVPVASQKTSEIYLGNGGTIPAGVIGVTGTTLGVTADGNAGTYENKSDAVSNAAGFKETVSQQSPGELKRLSVAVVVDQAALDAVGADTQALQQLIVAAVGADVKSVAEGGRGDTVEVQAQTFDVAAVAAADEAAKAAAGAQSKDKIVGYAKTGGALLVLLLAVLFLRKGLKSRREEIDEIDEFTLARSAEPFGVLHAADVPTASHTPLSANALRPVPVGAGVGGALGSGTEDRDDGRRALDPAAEVLDLIDREPEDVAALLRSWVADRRS
ncbi:MAG: flagellar basal-body MS-ring/collar protein FliF [Acidimicrobiales bacterium]